MPTRKELEYLECVKLTQWRDANKILWPVLSTLVYIPNEGKRSMRAGIKMSLAGLTKGVPDFAILSQIRGFKGGMVGIEMKVPGNGQSKEQKAFQVLFEGLGNTYLLCFSALEAVRKLRPIIGIPEPSREYYIGEKQNGVL